MYVNFRNEPIDADMQSLDGFFSKVKNVAKKVGAAVAAPLTIPTVGLVKATTHLAAKTGWKPLTKVNSKVTDFYRSDVVDFARKAYGVQMAVGAAVGGAILAAPVVGAGVSKIGASTLISGAAKAVKAVKGSTEVPAAPTQPPATAQAVPAQALAATPAGSVSLGDLGAVPTPVLLVGGALLLLALTSRR